MSGIDEVSSMYDEWYQKDSFGNGGEEAWAVIAAAISYWFPDARTLLDVGCGGGALMRAWDALGLGEAHGIEGSRAAIYCWPERIRLHDLREPLIEEIGPCDIVTCFDVAEHLSAEYADTLVHNIGWGCNRIVIFGAAPEGQDGHGHVNCQHPTYWIAKFERIGLNLQAGMSEALRSSIKANPDHAARWWVAKNLMVFIPNE